MTGGDAGERPQDWFARAGLHDQEFPAGTLYVVALPLGNAADITLRALWILSRVDAIAAEDTRVTRPLLERFGIGTALLASHEHNERKAAEAIVARLGRGERIAVVTDAGTPAVSDPGALLVRAVHDAGFRVVPIPGASALITALSAAGLGRSEFDFVGFLPTAAGQRDQAIDQLMRRGRPVVLYEAPHRIRSLMSALSQRLEPDRRVVVARELTKKFEQVSVTAASDLATLDVPERGEFVVIVDAAPAPDGSTQIDEAAERWIAALAAELPPARAAAIVARMTGASRDALYALVTQGRRR